MERIRRLEIRSEWRETEERKRNIIKGLNVGEGKIEKIKDIMRRRSEG